MQPRVTSPGLQHVGVRWAPRVSTGGLSWGGSGEGWAPTGKLRATDQGRRGWPHLQTLDLGLHLCHPSSLAE